MKSLVPFVLAASLCSCAHSKPAATSTATPGIKVAARPLASPAPLSIVTQPVPNKPIVSFRLVFHTGAIDDPKGKEGLTALTTRLMAEGGTQKLSSAELLEALFPMAAELDASTDKELTVFTGRVHQDKLAGFFEIFSDVLLNPRFDPKELERLRTHALNTITTRLRGENDEELGKVALDALLYAGHPYRHFNGGTVQGLKSITLEDVKKHAAQVYTQDRLVIGLAGAVDPKLEALVRDTFSKLPAKGAPAVKLPDVTAPAAKTVIVQRETQSTAGSFGFTYDLRRDDPDFFAVALALSYLGEHRQQHGQLFTELREKRGLNYGTYSYAEHFRQAPGTSLPDVNVARATQDVSLWLRPVEPQNAFFATRGVLFLLDRMLKEPIAPDAFETARGFLLGYTRVWEQTDQRRLGYAIDGLLYGTPNFLENFRAALEKLDAAQMQAAARRHLSLDRLNFVFVTRDAAALKAALSSGAPSPISYPTPKPPEVLELDKKIAAFHLPLNPKAIEIVTAQQVMER